MKNPITFYTDITTKISKYCLCNIKPFLKNDIRLQNKISIQIDPSVKELMKNPEFTFINELHQIARQNKFPISIDYPSDMNIQYKTQFLEKTNQNNKIYCNLLNYITTIQFFVQDFNSFITNFNLNKPYINSKKILGIGNLCRIKYANKFLDLLFNFLEETNIQCKRIHFFGLAMNPIKKYIPSLAEKFNITIDSTKFTKPVKNELKLKYGTNCNTKNRDLFFIEYMKEIESLGLTVIY